MLKKNQSDDLKVADITVPIMPTFDSLGGVVPGLSLQTDPLNPLKPIPLGRAMAREQESPTAACTFPQTSPPTMQGISAPLMGSVMGADGLTAQGVRAQSIFMISVLRFRVQLTMFVFCCCLCFSPLVRSLY